MYRILIKFVFPKDEYCNDSDSLSLWALDFQMQTPVIQVFDAQHGCLPAHAALVRMLRHDNQTFALSCVLYD